MKRKISLVILLAILMSCTKNNSPDLGGNVRAFSANQISIPLSELKERAFRGDTNAYDLLQINLMDYPPEDALFGALHFANQFHYPIAYFDVYISLKSIYEFQFAYEDLAPEIRKMMDEYLQMAIERNVDGAKEALTERSSNPNWWSGPLSE